MQNYGFWVVLVSEIPRTRHMAASVREADHQHRFPVFEDEKTVETNVR